MAAIDDFEQKWQKLIAEAWADPELKKRLVEDPAMVLAERGIKLPPGVQATIVEDSASVTHFVFPQKPRDFELSEEELEGVAGGHFGGCRGCRGCRYCRGCRRCRC